MLIVRNGCCQIGLAKVGVAAAKVGACEIRIEADRMCVVLNGAAIIVLL